MAKRYARLNWQNKPSVATPINATNLNKMDKGIDDIDTALNNLENSIVGQIVNDPTKINNAAVNYSLKQSIDAINNNFSKFHKNYAMPIIDAATDWNSLTEGGTYNVTSVAGNNAPPLSYPYGALINFFLVPTLVVQIYIPHSATHYPVWRANYGGGWIAWKGFKA